MNQCVVSQGYEILSVDKDAKSTVKVIFSIQTNSVKYRYCTCNLIVIIFPGKNYGENQILNVL